MNEPAKDFFGEDIDPYVLPTIGDRLVVGKEAIQDILRWGDLTWEVKAPAAKEAGLIFFHRIPTGGAAWAGWKKQLEAFHRFEKRARREGKAVIWPTGK